MRCDFTDRKFCENTSELISGERKPAGLSWEDRPGDGVGRGPRELSAMKGVGSTSTGVTDTCMGVHICQNPSNRTLKIHAVTVYKLYLNEEKVYYIAFLCDTFF